MDVLIICIFKGMHWKRFRPWLIPLIFAFCIKIFSFFPNAVERYYSTGIYPWIARLLRLLFGWIPFSIGDILYAAVFIYLVTSLVRFFVRAFRRKLHRQYLVLSLKKWFSILLWVYIAFNIFWGLNYDRLPIARQQHLDTKPYTKEDLQALIGLLVTRMNGIDSASRAARENLYSNDSLFKYSVAAYRRAAKTEPELLYTHPSVKFSF